MRWPILDELPEEHRQTLLAAARRHTYARGEMMLREGEMGDRLYLIEAGHAAVQRRLPTGEVGTLIVLGAGEVVGELAVIAPAPRNATVVALDEVRASSLGAAAFDSVRAAYPGVDRVLVNALAGEVRRLSRMLMEALYLPAEARIVNRLFDLVRVFGDPGPRDGGPIAIPFTQEELGQLAGATRPTVNRVLRTAVECGELELRRGQIIVRDPAALRRRLDG